VAWISHPIEHGALEIDAIEWFNARGMSRLYARADHQRARTCNLDLWQDKAGELRVPFWSRTEDIDDECWKLKMLLKT
jgi:hypothetical protein